MKKHKKGNYKEKLMQIEFRKAENEDLHVLGQMNKELIEDEGHSNPMNIDELTDRMRDILNSVYTSYLIMVDGTISGYCLFRDDESCIYIRQLFVERSKRRIGLGRACVKWLKSNFWIDRKIIIEVLSLNDNGIKFWRSIGFRDYCIVMELSD
jgi:predicted acetyltransferase